jgi:hypothetical protein
MAFRLFAPDREFNPLVIVFPPWKWPRPFCFYRAFASFKHDSPEGVEAITSELFLMLDRLSPAPAYLRNYRQQGRVGAVDGSWK